jgi:hypothetical protein
MQREAQARIHTLVASVADKSKLGGSAIVGQLGSLIKTEKPKVRALHRWLWVCMCVCICICIHLYIYIYISAQARARGWGRLRALAVACGRTRMSGLQLPGQLDKGDETGDDEGDDDGDQPDDGMPGRQVHGGPPGRNPYSSQSALRGPPCGIRPPS